MSADENHPDEMSVVERLGVLADEAMSDKVNLGLRDVIRQVEECIEDGLRDCGHCGSPFTFRRADGDIGCYDCPGIMPDTGAVRDITGGCPSCDGYLFHESPEYHGDHMTERITCEDCGTVFRQRWTFAGVEEVDG